MMPTTRRRFIRELVIGTLGAVAVAALVDAGCNATAAHAYEGPKEYETRHEVESYDLVGDQAPASCDPPMQTQPREVDWRPN